jgi:hypothetical protein
LNSISDSCQIRKPKPDCESTVLTNIINCKQCELNGFMDEKIFLKFIGLRPETEDGFIYKFAEYDDSNLQRKHVHKSSKTEVTAKARSKKQITDRDHIRGIAHIV